MTKKEIIYFLKRKVNLYNRKSFITNDPISIPHSFTKKQDIEIAGLFASVFAWGNRKIIIHKTNELMNLMDNSPYQFITQHQEVDLKKFLPFKHRTFQSDDLFYFIQFMKNHYSQYHSLENAFGGKNVFSMRDRLIYFHHYFFSLEHLKRTQKHISTPQKNSACKRLNMFLRWMVRKDQHGVDFGLWQDISMSELCIPLDLHVANVSYRLGLLPNKKSTWKNVETITNFCKEISPQDPAQFDFALFALGVEEKFK